VQENAAEVLVHSIQVKQHRSGRSHGFISAPQKHTLEDPAMNRRNYGLMK
jgi:hypothetical protein